MFTWASLGAALPRIYCYLLGLPAEQYGAAGCQGSESSMLRAACRPGQRPGRPLTYSGPVRQG